MIINEEWIKRKKLLEQIQFGICPDCGNDLFDVYDGTELRIRCHSCDRNQNLVDKYPWLKNFGIK